MGGLIAQKFFRGIEINMFWYQKDGGAPVVPPATDIRYGI